MNEVTLKKLEKKLKKVKIESFIINQGNERIFEFFKSKKMKEKPTKVYSITKSIISILIGILVERKQIDIQTPLLHYFPEMENSFDLQKKDITLFHLLTMTSGLKVVNFQASKNWVNSILSQPVTNELICSLDC